jgi:hypothetical protein
VILVPMVIDLAIHGSGVAPGNFCRLFVLGRGCRLCLFAGTHRECREESFKLRAAAGRALWRRITVAGWSNEYLEFPRTGVASEVE